MQSAPQISPDGGYWWDGQAWQPMPVGNVEVPVAQPAPEASRPSWLPAEVEVPTAGAPPGLPLISSSAYTGAPVSAVFAPAWANEPPPPLRSLSITNKVLLWAGLVLGGGVFLFGVIGVPLAMGESGLDRVDTMTSAVLFLVVGAAVSALCLGVILGFGPVVSGSLHSLGILGCTTVLGLILNTAAAVTLQVGRAGYIVPWGTVALVGFRAWRGRWVGAGIIVGVWAVCAVIILTMARP